MRRVLMVLAVIALIAVPVMFVPLSIAFFDIAVSTDPSSSQATSVTNLLLLGGAAWLVSLVYVIWYVDHRRS